MDTLLDGAYSDVVRKYQVAPLVSMGEMKKRILKDQVAPIGPHPDGGGRLLRPDAALCLLSLFDQMIARPYSDAYFTAGKVDTIAPATSPFFTTLALDASIEDSFDVLWDELKKNKKETLASSHDVILAIESRWSTLSSLIGWA